MPGKSPSISKSGALHIPPNPETITLAFLIDGEPVRLKRDEHGAIEAQFYVRLVSGRPFTVEPREELAAALAEALELGSAVGWRRP